MELIFALSEKVCIFSLCASKGFVRWPAQLFKLTVLLTCADQRKWAYHRKFEGRGWSFHLVFKLWPLLKAQPIASAEQGEQIGNKPSEGPGKCLFDQWPELWNITYNLLFGNLLDFGTGFGSGEPKKRQELWSKWQSCRASCTRHSTRSIKKRWSAGFYLSKRMS